MSLEERVSQPPGVAATTFGLGSVILLARVCGMTRLDVVCDNGMSLITMKSTMVHGISDDGR